MSKVINVSDDLGKLLLDGWKLSDRTCPAKGCRAIPLLRSPEGDDLWFCPSCESNILDPGPSHSESQQPSSPSLGPSTHYSRSSTPPTEDADVPGSPTFAIPAETEESIRRRQQSDLASAEIGRRLLRGWAMLGEECPRSTCYGIPLVRPPKTGQEKDPRKECVVCSTVYVAQGLNSLVPLTSSVSRQEEKPSSSAPLLGSNVTRKGKEKAYENHHPAVPYAASHSIGTSSAAPAVLASSKPPLPNATNAFYEPTPTSEDVLASSSTALGTTLGALSRRLLHLSGQPNLDPVTISQIAEAIAKTGQALDVISYLRRKQA
jgi:uncharacterized Zn finger protein (UPF0148 family)